jgi:hypothetical protein
MKTKFLFLIVWLSLKIAFAQTGIVNQALSLDGSGACVDIPNSASLNPGSNFTVEALVNFQVGGSQNPRIFSKGWQASGGYELLTSGTTDKRNVAFYLGQTVITSASVLSAGSWNYVAVTYDGNMFRMYINGTLDSTYQAPGLFLTNSFDVNIGRNAGNFTDHYQGLIDEVHLWIGHFRELKSKRT